MSNALRILVVEDDEMTAWAIEEALTASGYSVCGKAADYESAIRTMKQHSPDLAVIDVKLGGEIDGVSTAWELMRIKWLPLIYLTASTEMEVYKRARKTYPAAFLLKPFRPIELSMQIDLALTNFYQGNIPSGAKLSGDLFVWDDQGYVRISSDQIVFVKANGAYCELFLTTQEFARIKRQSVYQPMVISIPFGYVLPHLSRKFYKVGRSVCINLDYLDRIEASRVFLQQHEVPLPEGTHKTLIEQLNVVKSRKRS